MESNPLTEDQRSALRGLPAVEILLSHPSVQSLLSQYAREIIVAETRTVLDETRQAILAGVRVDILPDTLAESVEERLAARFRPRLRPVINLTGTVTHTNLGRSLLGDDACQHLTQIAGHYSNLEFDLDEGRRGHRDLLVEPYLHEFTGCEAATVVNNNAAAVMLVLNTLAAGREVVVSRGELIEIGGAFRIPDIMQASQAILREVGTTNRTYVRDYEQAIHDQTALLLKVHPSNYKVEGFASTPGAEEIAEVGHRRGIPTMEDLGSGALIDLRRFGLPYEPVVRERVIAGIDVITFSGDKLLGGPQAGIIVGRRTLIEQIRRNPLMRALRVGKLTLSALEGTLRCYLRPTETLPESLPMLRFLTRDPEQVFQVAENVAQRLLALLVNVDVNVESTHAQIGSGSLPVDLLPSVSVVLAPHDCSVETLAAGFRAWRVPILGRIQEDRLYFDMRTASEEDLDEICAAAGDVAQRINEAACVM